MANKRSAKNKVIDLNQRMSQANSEINEPGVLFTFVGNGNDDPKEIKLYGLSFKLNGHPIRVVNDFAISKLKYNSHFSQS